MLDIKNGNRDMFKNGQILIIVLIVLGVIAFGYAKARENSALRADAASAIAAVNEHMRLADGVINYKKQHGMYPDEKIYKTWGNLDRSKVQDEDQSRAREIFRSVYNEMDAFKSQNFTLTRSMGFSDGKWVYFTHTDLGRGADVTGLISKVQPGLNYSKDKVSFSDLDLLVEYKDTEPRHIRIQCLPLNEYQVKVCRKVLRYFRKQKSPDALYFVPQKKVTINDIVFE